MSSRKKRKSQDNEKKSEEDNDCYLHCLDLCVKLDPKKIEKIMKSYDFFRPKTEDIWWSTKSAFFDVVDSVSGLPTDTTHAITISYSRAQWCTPSSAPVSIGRLVSSPNINNLMREWKQSLLSEYYDIDISSCHANLCLYLNDTYGFQIPLLSIRYLVENKQTVIQKISDKYFVSHQKAKQYVTALLFGQSEASFYKENGIPRDNQKPLDEVTGISKDIRLLIEQLKTTPQWKIFSTYVKHKDASATNEDYKILAHWLQTIECDILIDVLRHLNYIHQKNSDDSFFSAGSDERLYIVPAHDGFYIHKNQVHNIQELLQSVNKMCTKKYSPYIKFVHKEMDQAIQLDPSTEINFYVDSYEKINAQEVALQLAKDVAKDFKVYSSIDKRYMWNGHIWSPDKDMHKILLHPEIIKAIDRAINNVKYFYKNAPSTYKIKKKNDDGEWEEELIPTKWPKILSTWIKILTDKKSGSHYNDVYKTISESICEVKDNSLFDSNPYIFCFTNKYYNLKTRKAFDPDKNLLMTISCGYEYQDLMQTDDFIDKFYKDLMEDPDERQNLIWWCGTGLIGQHYNLFYVALGEGSNGKSVLSLWMKELLGHYYYAMPKGALYAKETNGPNENLSNAHVKRYIVITEPPADEKFQADRLKEWTGAVSATGRGNYQKNGEIKLHGSLTIEANQLPKIEIKDDSIQRRFLGSKFKSLFTAKQNMQSYQDQFKLENLPIERVKEAIPVYGTSYFARSIRQKLFFYLVDNLQSFFDNNEIFKPNDCALAQAYKYTPTLIIPEGGDANEENLSTWFQNNYVYILDKIKDGRQSISEQLEYIFKLAYTEKKSGIRKKLFKDPKEDSKLDVRDIISLSTYEVWTDYKNSYSGEDKIKTYEEFKQKFNPWRMVTDHIIDKGQTLQLNGQKLVWKVLKPFFKTEGKLYELTYTKGGEGKAMQDTNHPRLLNYISKHSSLWEHIEEEKKKEEEATKKTNKQGNILVQVFSSTAQPVAEMEDKEMPHQREASPESSRSIAADPFQDGME